MYFSAEDRGEMMSMVYNWPADQVCDSYSIIKANHVSTYVYQYLCTWACLFLLKTSNDLSIPIISF